MTYFEFNEKFPTNGSILQHFRTIRYKNRLVCPHCKSTQQVGLRTDQPKLCNCNHCHNTFSIFTGTIFEKSSTDLKKWFFAVHLVLNAVTPEDEKMFFLNIEYLKNYNGAIIGHVHNDGFGNIFDVFLTKNIGSLDDLYTWNSFEEAKKKLEGQENPSSKCFSLKEGLRIGFEHEMVLSDCYPDTVFEPKWVSLYNEWVVQKNEYKRRFMTEEDLKQRSDFFLSIANGIQSAINFRNSLDIRIHF